MLLLRTEFMARIILSKKKFRSLRKKLTKLNIFPQLNPLDNRSGSKRKQSAFFGPCLVLEVARLGTAPNRPFADRERPRTTENQSTGRASLRGLCVLDVSHLTVCKLLCQACFCSGPASYSKWQESPWLVFLTCNLLIEAFFFPVERVSRRTGKGESFLPGITTKLQCDSGATGQPDLSFWENAFFTEIFCQKPVTVLCKRLTRRLPSPCTASSQAFFVNAFSVTYPRRWSLGTWQIRRDGLANVIANVTKGP